MQWRNLFSYAKLFLTFLERNLAFESFSNLLQSNQELRFSNDTFFYQSFTLSRLLFPKNSFVIPQNQYFRTNFAFENNFLIQIVFSKKILNIMTRQWIMFWEKFQIQEHSKEISKYKNENRKIRGKISVKKFMISYFKWISFSKK